MKTIDYNQLKEMLEQEENFLLINVLPRESFEEKHIPGSINIPVQEEGFVEKVEKQAGSKSKKIIVYCASFECDASSSAAEKLEEAGFSDVLDFEGGNQEWFEHAEKLAEAQK